MSDKVRQIDQPYMQCDWCDKEIKAGVGFGDGQKFYDISGDFPSVHVHEDTCLRQSVATGIKNKLNPN